MKKVEIIKKTLVFDDFFKIEEIFLSHERFNGKMSPIMRRLNFERGDSVAALVINKDNRKIILIDQFRYPTYEKGPGWITEIVAGVLKKDEDPENAIRREIFEETGYNAKVIDYICTFYVSPGGSSERIFLYYAEVTNKDKVSEGGGVATEHEDIQVKEYSWSEIDRLLKTGKIIDAKTIIALMYFQKQIE